jgi:hypothetical protein
LLVGRRWSQGRTTQERGRFVVYASVGDRLVVHGLHVDDPERDGEILEVRGENGAPPYVVRWSDTGHEAFVFPGPDATVHHAEHRSNGPGAGGKTART